MARRARVEYEGAVYHVLDRGDRREPIFQDGTDRCRFLETLGEVCQRTGWRVHAYVLMSNHYHFLLETPEANLVTGMRWFQTTWKGPLGEPLRAALFRPSTTGGGCRYGRQAGGVQGCVRYSAEIIRTHAASETSRCAAGSETAFGDTVARVACWLSNQSASHAL